MDTYTDHMLTAKQVSVDKSDPRALKFKVLDKFVKTVQVHITAL